MRVKFKADSNKSHNKFYLGDDTHSLKFKCRYFRYGQLYVDEDNKYAVENKWMRKKRGKVVSFGPFKS